MQHDNDLVDTRNDRHRLPETDEWKHISRMDGSDFKVAEGDADVRGWVVRGNDTRVIGTVSDLLINTRLMMVEFIEVEANGGTSHHVILPIRRAVLDETADEVQFLGDSIEASAYPVGMPGTNDEELSGDSSRFYGSRRMSR